MSQAERHFVPAAGHDWLLPFYDPLQRLIGGDAALRRFVAHAGVAAGQRVLDIGCGTGSLLVRLAGVEPRASLVGLDPDPRALARARRKAERAGAQIAFGRGFADALPFPDARFERVLSSFMFHHLDGDAKSASLREARRVLVPGGALHLLDFGGMGPNAVGLLGHLRHAAKALGENFEGAIPAQMREAGFPDAAEIDRRSSWLGQITHVRGSVPDRGEAGGEG